MVPMEKYLALHEKYDALRDELEEAKKVIAQLTTGKSERPKPPVKQPGKIIMFPTRAKG